MKTPEFIKKIDWSELRNQKAELLIAIEEAENKYGNPNPERADALNGILGLIDAVQDYAVDELNLRAIDVYDFELEDGERSDMLEGETDEEYFARTNTQTIFEMHIEGSMLYINEEMSREFIESIVDDPEHAKVIKSDMYANILNDVLDRPENFKKDANGRFTYDPEMYDYGYEIETYCKKIFNSGKTEVVWVCSKCGGKNVQYKSWVDANNLTLSRSIDAISSDSDDCWCNDCEEHIVLIRKEVPLN